MSASSGLATGAEGLGPRSTRQLATGGSPHSAVSFKVLWDREFGPGDSRVELVGDRAITLFSDGTDDLLVALDVDSGRQLWSYRIAPTFQGHDGSDDGPHASPVVDGEIVYGLGPRGHLFAVRLQDGSEVWRHDLVKTFESQQPFWGFASTPLVTANTLVVQTGGSRGRGVTGFSKASGEVIWTTGTDRFGYQSPALMELAGQVQVVAVSNQLVIGIEPDSGEVLWTHQHSDSELDGSSEPVSIGPNRFLLTSSVTENYSPGTLFEVERDSSGFAVRELWKSRTLRANYTVPALFGGCLLGFQGNILACVNAQTGRPIWRSREPRGKNFVMAKDQLIITTEDGHVVAARPQIDGYQETGRIAVFKRFAFTAPTVSDELIMVRNHARIAALQMVRAGEQPAGRSEDDQAASPTAKGAFGSFLESVQASSQKQLLVDEFMAAQDRFPIIENGRWIHFVYRGPAEDVAISGTLTDWGRSDAMKRVSGTDLFYLSYEVEPATRWQYSFQIDFGRFVRDPLNPAGPLPDSDRLSEVTLPGWKTPDFVNEPPDSRAEIREVAFDSRILGNQRTLKIYLPDGYSASRDRYPLLVVDDGLDVLQIGRLDRAAAALGGGAVANLVIVFAGPSEAPYQSHQESGGPDDYQEFGGPKTSQHARMLAEELVPFIEQEYRIRREAEARGLLGLNAAGLAVLYTAAHYPEVFGKVAVQSMYFGPTPVQSSELLDRPVFEQTIRRLQDGDPSALVLYLDWARQDLHSQAEGIDLARDSRRLLQLVRESGYSALGNEYAGGPGWPSWQSQFGTMLKWLFPKE